MVVQMQYFKSEWDVDKYSKKQIQIFSSRSDEKMETLNVKHV